MSDVFSSIDLLQQLAEACLLHQLTRAEALSAVSRTTGVCPEAFAAGASLRLSRSRQEGLAPQVGLSRARERPTRRPNVPLRSLGQAPAGELDVHPRVCARSRQQGEPSFAIWCTFPVLFSENTAPPAYIAQPPPSPERAARIFSALRAVATEHRPEVEWLGGDLRAKVSRRVRSLSMHPILMLGSEARSWAPGSAPAQDNCRVG